MKFIPLLPTLLLSCLVISTQAIAGKKVTSCEFPTEEPSEVLRTINLTKLGVSVQIPSNYRAIAKSDDTVLVVDKGTYKAIDCFKNNPLAQGERSGLIYLTLMRNYAKPDKVIQIPYSDNKWIGVIGNNQEGFDMFLRVKSKKGWVSIPGNHEGLITSEAEMKAVVGHLLEISNLITIN